MAENLSVEDQNEEKEQVNNIVGENGVSAPNIAEDRAQLALFILQKTEEKVAEQGSDKVLDRELQKIELLSGAMIVPKEIKDLIRNEARNYEVTFARDFYHELNKKVPWAKSESDLNKRPSYVAKITNEIIYDRFPKDILPRLQHLNPYVHLWVREFKHFQFLTDEGKLDLEKFITQSIEMMRQTETYYEFRLKYARKYGLTFQLSAFENNDLG